MAHDSSPSFKGFAGGTGATKHGFVCWACSNFITMIPNIPRLLSTKMLGTPQKFVDHPHPH